MLDSFSPFFFNYPSRNNKTDKEKESETMKKANFPRLYSFQLELQFSLSHLYGDFISVKFIFEFFFFRLLLLLVLLLSLSGTDIDSLFLFSFATVSIVTRLPTCQPSNVLLFLSLSLVGLLLLVFISLFLAFNLCDCVTFHDCD